MAEPHAAHPTGTEVTLAGLQSRPELNGRRGRVVSQAANGRVGVQVEGLDAPLSLKSENLTPWQGVPLSDEELQGMTEAKWMKKLSRTDYMVLRQKGTEPRGGYYDHFYPVEGHFVCKGCSAPLYSADAKFDSGCGWPAFDKCYKGAVSTIKDESHGMVRIEIICARCGGHLGHVFQGERKTETNERHCVNSVSVRYIAAAAPCSANEEEPVLPPMKQRVCMPVRATAIAEG